MRSRILVGLLAGVVGGLLGWLLQEHFINYNAHVLQGALPGQGVVIQPMTPAENRVLIYCVGGMIGLFLGAVDGIVEGSSRKLAQGMLAGALAGIVLGYVGLALGTTVYNALGGDEGTGRHIGLLGFAQQVIARSFGWGFLGLGLGAGSALATRSPKRIWHGVIGGFLGGFIGGFVFDILAISTSPVTEAVGASGIRDAGGPSRMVGFTAIGGLTGFFVGLVDELFKQAWVKVLAGRNEGKDFILSKPMNLMGRDERCDVPLYGDIAVGVQHAAIRGDGKRHVLLDGGTPTGTVVNGQRVPPGGEILLRDGDMIQIGTHRVLFREKATASKVARPALDVPAGKTAPGALKVPAHLCPFCGAPKDAAGNCRCTLPVTVAAPTSAPGDTIAAAYGGNAGPVYGGNVGIGIAGGYEGPSAVPGAFQDGIGQLVGIEGPYAGQVFALTGPNMSVGREPDRDIVLSADTTVSRNHARLANEGGGVVVYDNGSSNGTFVNGLRVSAPIALAPGDVVQFGNSKFRVG